MLCIFLYENCHQDLKFVTNISCLQHLSPTSSNRPSEKFIITNLTLPAREFLSDYFWWHLCWRRILETKCVGDNFKILVIEYIRWKNLRHNQKVANVMILPPKSQIGHHHKLTNITMSPTSPSSLNRFLKRGSDKPIFLEIDPINIIWLMKGHLKWMRFINYSKLIDENTNIAYL